MRVNNTEYIATQQHTQYTAAAHTTDTTYTHNTHRAVEGIAPEEEKLHQVLCYVAPGHVQPFYEVLHERVRVTCRNLKLRILNSFCQLNRRMQKHIANHGRN